MNKQHVEDLLLKVANLDHITLSLGLISSIVADIQVAADMTVNTSDLANYIDAEKWPSLTKEERQAAIAEFLANQAASEGADLIARRIHTMQRSSFFKSIADTHGKRLYDVSVTRSVTFNLTDLVASSDKEAVEIADRLLAPGYQFTTRRRELSRNGLSAILDSSITDADVFGYVVRQSHEEESRTYDENMELEGEEDEDGML